jgi:hypothetical protein
MGENVKCPDISARRQLPTNKGLKSLIDHGVETPARYINEVGHTRATDAEGRLRAIKKADTEGCTSEHKRLNRMGQATDFGGLAVQPKVIGDLLVALVHHHYGYFSIGIDKSSGKQLAPGG